MTQQTPLYSPRPEPGALVRLKSGSETGIVVSSDDWYDTLRLRGVDRSSQVLVEWLINGQPTRTWERVTFLEPAPSMPATNPAMPVVRP
jgi:hypothetical protein